MVLLWTVACVMGPSKLPSMPPVVCNQNTRPCYRSCRVDAKKHRPEKIRPVPLVVCLRRAFYRVGDAPAPVPVLVVGGDQVGITEDAVFVDVEAVELLLGLDPDADGRLEGGEDRQGGEEHEAARSDDAEGLDAELVEAPAVEQARLADRGEGRGREQAAGERAPDTAHAVRGDGAEGVVYPDLVHVNERRVHDDAGDEAYDDRGPRRDEGARRRDGDEGSAGSDAAHTHVDVAPVQVAHPHRAENARGRGQVRGKG